MSSPVKTHIQLQKSERHARVIVCGSPERAERMSKRLKGAECLARNREYHSYLGEHQGEAILITSHGVGSAGAAICFRELIDAGARAIVRIGTAGGLQDSSGIADLVVPTAAIRKDGASAQMVPIEYPAVPDAELMLGIRDRLRAQGHEPHCGVVVTSDLFYPERLSGQLELYRDARAVAVEMECSTLFVLGALHGVRTGAALVLDGNPLKWDKDHYDPRPERLAQSVDAAFEAVASTLASLKLGE